MLWNNFKLFWLIGWLAAVLSGKHIQDGISISWCCRKQIDLSVHDFGVNPKQDSSHTSFPGTEPLDSLGSNQMMLRHRHMMCSSIWGEIFLDTNITPPPRETLSPLWYQVLLTMYYYHTIPYHTNHTIPYHTIPYHTIPYHTIPTIPYHSIRCCYLFMINFKHSNIASLCNHQATKHGGVPCWKPPEPHMAAAVQLFLGAPRAENPRCGRSFSRSICARVDQLPLFPYNRGWETQPKSVGVYRAPWNKDSDIKGGRSPIPNTRSWSTLAHLDVSKTGWCFQIFFYFHPYLGKWSILTIIFLKWVETTN